MASYWEEWLRDRFRDRPVLERADLHALFGADLPAIPFGEFADFFELEYGAPAGILRPTDDLSRLLQPIRTHNPVKWFFVEPGLEDKAGEFMWQVGKRVKATGLVRSQPLRTIGECARVWCGLSPEAPTDGSKERAAVQQEDEGDER